MMELNHAFHAAQINGPMAPSRASLVALGLLDRTVSLARAPLDSASNALLATEYQVEFALRVSLVNIVMVQSLAIPVTLDPSLHLLPPPVKRAPLRLINAFLAQYQLVYAANVPLVMDSL